MRGDGPHAGEVARDQEGEVDRALRRPPPGGAVPAETPQAQEPRTVRLTEIRFALEQAINAGRAIVVLEVRRPGAGAVCARVPQMLWAAVCEALCPDRLGEEHAATQMDDG